MKKRLNHLYYSMRPIIPRPLQVGLRRVAAQRRRARCTEMWPIDERAGNPPRDWPGWPEGRQFALVLTHDVDTQRGQDRCNELLKLERKMGFRSAFNFVPRRYDVSADLRQTLRHSGFEVGVHGLYHDGKLYASRQIFSQRAVLINRYLEQWGAVGFRSPAMHHNLEWLLDLNIVYDASTFDTDPFEPQPDGAGTIFPFMVTASGFQRFFVELPYTLPQDFTLFILLQEATIDIWKRKLDWIAARGGMALLNAHPDYMCFSGRPKVDEYPVGFYLEFLDHVKERYKDSFWNALPREVAEYQIEVARGRGGIEGWHYQSEERCDA